MTPEQRAAAVLDRHGAGIPVPVETILAAAGVAVGRNHDDSDLSGFACRHGSRRIVGINTRTSPRRQRFALAHAFGHLLLHESDLVVCHSIRLNLPVYGARATDGQESVADRFAGALLMPRDLLVEALAVAIDDAHDSRDALIGALARRFEVSAEAMGWRLISLNLTMA